jgi:hypothetical protein
MEDDDLSQRAEVVRYVLSPPRVRTVCDDAEVICDADESEPFDALVHPTSGRKRCRSADLTTPNWSRHANHSLNGDGVSPADVSDEQAAQLLAAVETLQAALRKQQDAAITSSCGAPDLAAISDAEVTSPRSAASALSRVPAAAMLGVLAEAKQQLLQRTSPRNILAVSRLGPTSSAIVTPSRPPDAGRPNGCESDADSDELAAAFYDAVEAAVYANSASGAQGLSDAASGTSAASTAAVNGCASAASRVLTEMILRVSPQLRVRHAAASAAAAAATLSGRDLRVSPACAGGRGCQAESDAKVIDADVALRVELPLCAPRGSAKLPAAVPRGTCTNHEEEEEDYDLACLDMLEKSLCGGREPPPSAPPTPVLRWLHNEAPHSVSDADVARTLGAFADLSQSVSSARSSNRLRDPSLLVPVHLRCIVVAVSMVHAVTCRLRVPVAAGRSHPTASVRQRLWCVAYVSGGTDSSPRTVSRAMVALRGQWLECSRVSVGAVAHIVCVRRGRALPRGVAELEWAAECSAVDAAAAAAAPKAASLSSCGDLRLWSLRGDPAQAFDYEDSAGLGAYDPGRFTKNLPLVVVDDVSNAVVVHPDMLFGPTRIAGVTTCLRRAVLSEAIGDVGVADTYSYVAELGTLKHTLFEAALRFTAAAVDTDGPKSDSHSAAAQSHGAAPSTSAAAPQKWSGSSGASALLHTHLTSIARELVAQPAILLKLVSSGKTEAETLENLLAT